MTASLLDCRSELIALVWIGLRESALGGERPERLACYRSNLNLSDLWE